ncbi:MAG: hypothetical protein QM820_15720 [Minicystis sp.]
MEGELLERSPESADFHECTVLGLWWVVVPSAYGPMLRLARGTELLPTPTEERTRLVQALAEERRARADAEHQKMLAQQELREAQAEVERLRADLARARGETG